MATTTGLTPLAVPEHFASPLLQYHASQDPQNALFDLVSCPSGTGEMITRLKEDSIDVAIALTEALIAGIAKESGKAPFKIVGTFVMTPLDWAVSTGPGRSFESIQDLKGETMGISRIGSGSQIMANVMSFNHGWQIDDLQFKVMNTFEALRNGVQVDGSTAAFMWERFTTKPYTDKGEVRTIGHVLTPWPSWLIAARADCDQNRLLEFLHGLGHWTQEFDSEKSRQGPAIEYIQGTLGYPVTDIQDWIKTCRWSHEPWIVERTTIEKTLATLEQCQVIKKEERDLPSVVNTEVATLKGS